LVHDILITLGAFALLGFEVDAFFITALLTIMGFSVHDTIVVFDRIRENLKNQSRDETFGQIADKSLNQTLTRSINTSVSTLFTLVALYFLGAESIRIFVFALIIGILVGTYSSIFIASPILTIWQERRRLR
jgi:preprotein translocase SecF subunit